MSDEFSFEEVVQLDWLNDASRFTDKHMLTHSDVSQDHCFDFHSQHEAQTYSKIDDKATKMTKQKNKCNAKNYRDRKRQQLDTMKKQLEQLHQENAILKNQKVCRWCSRAFSPTVLAATISHHRKKQMDHSGCAFHSKDMEIQFQKPDLTEGARKPINHKIWVALGILLLVLGLTMHGVSGDKTYISKIELQRQQVKKWQSQLKGDDKSDYFNIDMRLEESPLQSTAKSKEIQDIFLHFRSPTQGKQNSEEQKISISKDMLFSIQAELDDIGAYL